MPKSLTRLLCTAAIALGFSAAPALGAWSYESDGLYGFSASAGAPGVDLTLSCTAPDFDGSVYGGPAPSPVDEGLVRVTIGYDVIGEGASRVTVGVDGRLFALRFRPNDRARVYQALTPVSSAFVSALRAGEAVSVRGADPRATTLSLAGSSKAIGELTSFCATPRDLSAVMSALVMSALLMSALVMSAPVMASLPKTS